MSTVLGVEQSCHWSPCLLLAGPVRMALFRANRGTFGNNGVAPGRVSDKERGNNNTVEWPRSLFLPVQARSCKERSGAGWDQDGPGWPPPRDLDGSETL